MALKNNAQSDSRGDKPSQKAKSGLTFPLGNAHWEKKAEDTKVADLRYGTEFGAPEEYKRSVDGLANYARTHKAQH